MNIAQIGFQYISMSLRHGDGRRATAEMVEYIFYDAPMGRVPGCQGILSRHGTDTAHLCPITYVCSAVYIAHLRLGV